MSDLRVIEKGNEFIFELKCDKVTISHNEKTGEVTIETENFLFTVVDGKLFFNRKND